MKNKNVSNEISKEMSRRGKLGWKGTVAKIIREAKEKELKEKAAETKKDN